MEPGVRRLEIEEDRRRASHPTAVRGCVGAAPRGQGHASGVTPLARPCHRCRGSVGEGNRRERSGHGVEKMNRRADMRARVAAAASEGGEARGRERRAGWLLGLREFVGRPACGRACALGRRWQAGWAGWAVKPRRLGP